MPTKFTPTSKFKSPFASAFKSGIKSGTPCGTVITNIAKSTGKPTSAIIKSLFKAGLCYTQKFNGTFICWPCFNVKTNASGANTCQTTLWQSFIDWCCLTGFSKPNQLDKKTGSQKTFMAACKSFFGKQFSGTVKTQAKSKFKSGRKSKNRKNWTKSRKSWTSPTTHWAKHSKKHRSKRTSANRSGSAWSRTYKFPTYKARSTNRRYVRAA